MIFLFVLFLFFLIPIPVPPKLLEFDSSEVCSTWQITQELYDESKTNLISDHNMLFYLLFLSHFEMKNYTLANAFFDKRIVVNGAQVTMFSYSKFIRIKNSFLRIFILIFTFLCFCFKKSMRGTLIQFVSAGQDFAQNDLPARVQTLQDLYDQYPEWSNPQTSFISLRDDQAYNNRDVLVQRVQLRSNCDIHAASQTYSYLLARNSTTTQAFDVNQWVLSWKPFEIFKYLFFQGGLTSHVFKTLVNTKVVSVGSRLYDDLPYFLRKYGVGLLPLFTVYQDFFDHSSPSFDGDPTGSVIGNHAMILIGCREDTHGKRYYLFQNFWSSFQFVEISQSYLEKTALEVEFCSGAPSTECNKYSFPSKFMASLQGLEWTAELFPQYLGAKSEWHFRFAN